MPRNYIGAEDHRPYSDKKLNQAIAERLTLQVIVCIQQLDCQGKKPREIAEHVAKELDTHVTDEQIRHVLDPETKPMRQQRAGLGYGRMKEIR
jgi:hypothetical protein